MWGAVVVGARQCVSGATNDLVVCASSSLLCYSEKEEVTIISCHVYSLERVAGREKRDTTHLICNSRPHGDKCLHHAKEVSGLLTCPTQPQSLFSPAIHLPSFPSVSPFSSLPLGPYAFNCVWSGLLLCTHYTWWENTHLFYDRYIETRP